VSSSSLLVATRGKAGRGTRLFLELQSAERACKPVSASAHWSARRPALTVAEGMGPVQVALQPDFGWLTVTSKPAGLQVTVDGKAVGATPLTRHELAPGGYKVLVTDPRYYDQGKTVRIVRGKVRRGR